MTPEELLNQATEYLLNNKLEDAENSIVEYKKARRLGAPQPKDGDVRLNRLNLQIMAAHAREMNQNEC